MANKKGNPLSGAFRSPAPDDSPPWEEKKTDPAKEVTADPKATTTPGKPGEEKKPTEPPKVVTPASKSTTTPR